MKKLLAFISFCLLVVAVYFGARIALKEYFNEFYYYTPQLVGENIDKSILAVKELPVNIHEVEREFSDKPAGEIFLQDPEAGKVIKRNRTISVWVSKGKEDLKVPDVRSLDENDARSIVNSKGLLIGNIVTVSLPMAEGVIVATEPEIGTAVSRGDKISLLVNRNSAASTVTVPDLIGLTLEEARVLLQDNALVLGEIVYQKFKDIEPGLVVNTTVEANKIVNSGTIIGVTISQ